MALTYDSRRYDSNYFAYLVLLMWPAVALYLYSRLPVAQATLWTLLSAYLLLPVHTEFHFHGIPIDFDKRSVASLSALIGCTLVAGRSLRIFRGFGFAEILILIFIVAPFISSMLNGDPIDYGKVHLPSVGAYDGCAAVVEQFIAFLPFFLGRQFLRSSEDNIKILQALAIAGLAYSLPMLFEVRMSPQLHYWLYGYLPFGFQC